MLFSQPYFQLVKDVFYFSNKPFNSFCPDRFHDRAQTQEPNLKQKDLYVFLISLSTGLGVSWLLLLCFFV